MEGIVGAIIKSVLSFFKLWYDGERREAVEWEAKAMAGKMESMKTTDRIEREINVTVPEEIITTAAAWNKKARLRGAGLLLLLCLLLPGCLFTKYVYIEGEWPTIEAPAMPLLPEDPPGLTPREVLLATHADALDAKIVKYNAAARAHNIKHGYAEPEGEDDGG